MDSSQAFWSMGFFPERILEWVAISYTRGSFPNPGIEPKSPASPTLAGGFFYHWEAHTDAAGGRKREGLFSM